MKILILKPSSLGDIVHALPVLRQLKAYHPNSQIHWWVASGFAPLLQGDPDLAGLIVFNRRGWQSPWRMAELLRSVRAMRRECFDLIIDLQGLARSGLVAWLANGAHTIGLSNPREGARGLYDVAVDRPVGRSHAVDWYLEVLARLGVPRSDDLECLPARPDIAADVRGKWPVGDHSWVVVCPGARWLNKRWPVAHFQELVRLLGSREPAWRFALMGSHDDISLSREIASALPDRCLDLAGATTLPEMVEWMRLSRGVITNDSGPVHIAAALGRPLTAIYGPTTPGQTGPYGNAAGVLQSAQTPCVPCMRSVCRHNLPLACMWDVTPAQVAVRFLSQVTGPGAAESQMHPNH